MLLKQLLIEAQGHSIPPSTEVRTFADEPGFLPVSGPTIGRLANGDFVFAQWPIISRDALAPAEWLRRELPTIRFGKYKRMSGFAPISTTFGFAPAEPIRKRYACTLCGFDQQHPRVAYALRALLGAVSRTVREQLPDEYAEYEAKVASLIHPDYWLGGTPWTSGVINDKTMLPYHFDRSNVENGLSIQVNLRRNATGGALHFPEYNLWLANDDLTVAVFRGGAVYHAVTPIHLQTTDAHRYSIVFYAKQGLRRCGPFAAEADRAAEYQTRILRKRIDPNESDDSLA